MNDKELLGLQVAVPGRLDNTIWKAAALRLQMATLWLGGRRSKLAQWAELQAVFLAAMEELNSGESP